jgi:hypothetical protein
MKLLKTLLATAAVGAIVIAFRDVEGGRWLRPAVPGRGGMDLDDLGFEDEEPVLGFDGMDRDTLIDWLGEAELDDQALRRIRGYEITHQGRQPVLDALEDLLGARA